MSRRGSFVIFAGLLWVLVLLASTAVPASAHAFLERSDPPANSVVPNAPAEVQLWFTERLEAGSTKAKLVDHLGNTIEGTSYHVGEPKQLIVTLPSGLGKGTYSIVWQNLSTDDGHPASGYLPFTIGSAADIQQITVPIEESTPAGAPEWLRAGSRWLAFLGLFFAASLWPIWSLVLWPAVRRSSNATARVRQLLRWLPFAAIGAAVAGNITALLVQAAEPGGSYGSSLRTTLLDTRYGDLWMARLAGLAVLAVLLAFANWTRPWRQRRLSFLTLLASAALVIPFSLNSHANAQTTGRTFAIVADAAHLAAAALWGGGALILLIALWLFRSSPALKSVAALAIPRFSFLALAAWIMLAVTGAYAAWVDVANIDGALDTTYGNAFLIKMAIAVVLLGFGATHLLVMTKRIRRASDGERWSRRFLWTLGAEVAAIIAVLLVTGWLTSEPPAREVLDQRNAGITVNLTANGIDGTLTVTPGTAGPNHIRLHLDGSAIPQDADGLLRLTASDAGFGTQEIELTSVGGNTWETHGSQFSLVGDWNVEAIVRKIGEFQWQTSGAVAIRGAAASGPSAAWHFNTSAISGLALLLIGSASIGWAVTAGRGTPRKEASGIASAALIAGLLLVVQGRIDAPATIDTTLADDATLARGQAVYSAQCMACHGVNGDGNGPAAVNMTVPPANFTDPSHLIHGSSVMESYVRNGFPNSGMPGFEGVLTDQQISDVVAYIRSFALKSGAGLDIPDASECTVAPRDAATLITSSPPAVSDTTVDLGPPVIEWPQGQPASNDDVTAITTTVRQFVACTNANDYGRTLALSTTNYLEPQFAKLDAAARQSALDRAATPGEPLAVGSQLGIESINEVYRLEDGRIGALVTTVDPVNDPHVTTAVLIFARENGMWKIDETHRVATAATPASASQPGTTFPMAAELDGYAVNFYVSAGDNDARPVRVTLRTSDGQAVNDATIQIYFTPRAVGVPSQVILENSDPASYTGHVELPESGAIDASIEITLADGTQLQTVLTFTQ